LPPSGDILPLRCGICFGYIRHAPFPLPQRDCHLLLPHVAALRLAGYDASNKHTLPSHSLKICAHFFNIISPKKAHGSLLASVLRRIRAKGAPWGFTSTDFADLGDPRSIGMILTRLSRKEVIRRVRRGVYETTRQHPLIGPVGAGTKQGTGKIFASRRYRKGNDEGADRRGDETSEGDFGDD
jgi:hypothetical protein